MKKWMISLLILLALCMGACTTTDNIGKESISGNADLDLEDYQYLADTFVLPFINGTGRIDDDGYADEYAYRLLEFCALNHPEEVGNVDEAASYRFDAPTVDAFLQRYFRFRDTACMRDGSVEYDADTDEYILTGFSSSRRVCTILHAQREGEILTLEYEYSWPEYVDDWRLVGEAILTIDPEVLEPLVQQYFEVSSGALRSTQYFSYTDDEVGNLYEGAYRLPLIESDWWMSALHVEEEGDLLYITVGVYSGQDDVVSRPFTISDVTIRVEEDGFKYLACHVEW